jgi:chemotaxis protein methyltransferase CheR
MQNDRSLEFEFTDQDFRFIADLLYKETGIVLKEHKKQMAYSRLARRLRQLNLKDFKSYCAVLEGPEGAQELGRTLNALTTNLTRFFRENHHFEHLRDQAIPEIIAHTAQSPTKPRVRLWSAACSSGEEPYSIAMVIRDAIPNLVHWDARILATDIDTDMVHFGATGCYMGSRMDGLSPAQKKRYFTATKTTDHYQATAEIRELITFKKLNLLRPWPMQGPFDVIFCRNVVIYFDKPTQQNLFKRLAKMLRPGGYLYIGHSENILGLSEAYQLMGKCIYRRTSLPNTALATTP